MGQTDTAADERGRVSFTKRSKTRAFQQSGRAFGGRGRVELHGPRRCQSGSRFGVEGEQGAGVGAPPKRCAPCAPSTPGASLYSSPATRNRPVLGGRV